MALDRTRLQGYLALALAFLLGAIVGGALLHAYMRHRLFDRWADEGPRFAEQHRERLLARKLDLDPAQGAQLHQIFEQHGKRLHDLTQSTLTQCGAPLHDEQQKMDQEIRALLRPNQLPLFDRMLAHRPPPPFPPPPMGRRP
ncbi:MAG TPA: hypothetical protein VL137_10235 [Polyangiaceae bacterium]|nr:hypothetical protein [Polyangiaceae bacterium]